MPDGNTHVRLAAEALRSGRGAGDLPQVAYNEFRAAGFDLEDAHLMTVSFRQLCIIQLRKNQCLPLELELSWLALSQED